MNNISGLDLVGSFLVVAEELNFRRSAERLNLDQSALSRRVQKLEHLLGFKLLERNTREVALTPAGQSFYRDNSAMVDRYRESISAARRVAAGQTGGLRIGYMTFAAPRLMPGFLAAFHALYPYVQLTTTYLRTQAQKLALAKHEIDAGFMINRFDHPDFESIEMSDEALFAILPARHPLAECDAVKLADLVDQPLILGQMREWDEYRWQLEGLFGAEGLDLTARFEADHTLAITGLVATGLGITIFPESLISLLDDKVTARPIDNPAFRTRTALVWRRQQNSPELEAFVRLVKERS